VDLHVLLATTALLATSCTPLPPVWSVRVGGVSKQMSKEEYDRVRLQALKDQAGEDLDCKNGIAVKESTLEGAVGEHLFSVDGCGHRAIYAEVQCMARWDDSIQGFNPVYTQRFVPVSLAITDEQRYGGDVGDCSGKRVVESVSYLAALNEQGARDLKCPRDQVLPGIVYTSSGIHGSRGHTASFAEGCGQRATYLPGSELRLSSVVKIGE
jgi:hypothetical protein